MLVLGMLVGFRFVTDGLEHQQIDILIAALVAVAGFLVLRGRWLAAAACCGVSAGLKATPLIWGLYFLVCRRWQAAGLLAVVAIGINLLPDLVSHPLATPPHGQPEKHAVWPGGRQAPGGVTRVGLECSIMLMLMVLLSPVSSKPHFLVVLLPAYCLARQAVHGPDRFAAACLGVALPFSLLSNRSLSWARSSASPCMGRRHHVVRVGPGGRLCGCPPAPRPIRARSTAVRPGAAVPALTDSATRWFLTPTAMRRARSGALVPPSSLFHPTHSPVQECGCLEMPEEWGHVFHPRAIPPHEAADDYTPPAEDQQVLAIARVFAQEHRQHIAGGARRGDLTEEKQPLRWSVSRRVSCPAPCSGTDRVLLSTY